MPDLHLPLDKLPAEVSRLYVAFSSGIDSCVLLHSLLNQQHDYSVVLWHINHGLQHNADQMQQLASELARQYKLEIRIDQLNLDAHAGNLEAVARTARYDLFCVALTAQDALLTAHHMNDQAETLMLNLMRGSGAAGLRAIADLTDLGQGYLLRPLLSYQRDEIEEYARQHHLTWVEDPSNQSLEYDRNYIRHQVLPHLRQRWPAVTQQLHRVCSWQSEQQQLLEELAQIDLKQCQRQHRFSAVPCLDINALTGLTIARQKNLIRYWISVNDRPQLGFKALHQVLSQMLASADGMPRIQASGYSLRSYDGLLFMVDDFEETALSEQYQVPDSQILKIPPIGLVINRKQLLEYLNASEQGQRFSLRFRTGSSNNALSRHRLKRLFQTYRVPPWLRDRVAQIYVNGALVDLLLL